MTVASATTELLLCVPYEPFVGNPARNEVILNACAEMPNLFPLPLETVEERKVAVAHVLTAPDTYTWEVWRGQALVGISVLSKAIPGLHALAHFVFFHRAPFGRTRCIKRLRGTVV